MGRKLKINDLELAFLVSKGMTQKEISEKLECSLPTVKAAMARVRKDNPELLELASTSDFRTGESDDLANLRRIVLISLRKKLNTMSLSTISLSQLAMLYGILFDKDRLLQGQSTENIATASYAQLDDKTRAVIGDAVKKLTDDMMKESRERAQEQE